MANDIINQLNNDIVEKLNLSPGMSDGVDDLIELIQNMIYSYLPDMALVRLDDFQDKNKQTYKSVCERLCIDNENLNHEVDDIKGKMSILETKNEQYKSINEKFFSNAEEILEGIRKQTEREIVVSNVRCFNYKDELIETESDHERHYNEEDLSVVPAVYEGRRPSWFSPLGKEFNQENVSKKTADRTKGTFLSQIAFWKKLSSSNAADNDKAKIIDFERRKKITELLNSDLLNEEKYVKYMLLTPGISRDLLKTLTGAEELGLDANVIISFLEQPNSEFNKEIFEAYVSQVRKGTDYNLKKEFAADLLREDWYIVSDVRGGKEQKYRLVPIDELNEIREKIDSITAVIKDLQKDSYESDTLCQVGTKSSEEIESYHEKQSIPKVMPTDEIPEEELPDINEDWEELGGDAMKDVYDG